MIFYHNFQSKKQILAPGVLVVGGNDKKSIQQNRERFRENAKEMLEQGYKIVCSLYLLLRSRLLILHSLGMDFSMYQAHLESA